MQEGVIVQKTLMNYIRDANFYGLPVVTTENCEGFQFSTDYGKLEFFYRKFIKKVAIRNVAKKKKIAK